jgi:hypothetical protein
MGEVNKPTHTAYLVFTVEGRHESGDPCHGEKIVFQLFVVCFEAVVHGNHFGVISINDVVPDVSLVVGFHHLQLVQGREPLTGVGGTIVGPEVPGAKER